MPKFLDKDGVALVRVIAPGKGSSAFYREDQLRRDAPVFKGAQVFLDHPTSKEAQERPERSLRDLVGVAVGDPEYRGDGPAGPGVYAPTKVFKPYRETIEELAPHIGVSIRASGTRVRDKVNGEDVWVAEKFVSGGFDFVTQAGAGGKVVPMLESVGYVDRFLEAHPQDHEESETTRAQFVEWALKQEETQPQNEEENMAENERIKELETQNAALVEQNTRLIEAVALREARDLVIEEVAKVKDLPVVTQARLTESLPKLAPIKEGKLDTESFTARIAQAVAEEKEYLEAIAPKGGKITGMGGGSAPSGSLRQTLIESYRANGKDQATAEAMADVFVRGR
uniref:Uncharacterized protein n=1 Tax=viral metagenome TaxID=1070528 RepID=A0A6H1Z7U8_9ZZZZ